MKSLNSSTVLIALGMIGLAWAAYQYTANPRINAANCGVTVVPVNTPVTIQSNTKTRVPMKLLNRFRRPVRIVGTNACCGVECDFGSKSLPLSIDEEGYEFAVMLYVGVNGEIDCQFDLFLDVDNVLVVFPVEFPVIIRAVESPSESSSAKEDGESQGTPE